MENLRSFKVSSRNGIKEIRTDNPKKFLLKVLRSYNQGKKYKKLYIFVHIIEDKDGRIIEIKYIVIDFESKSTFWRKHLIISTCFLFYGIDSRAIAVRKSNGAKIKSLQGLISQKLNVYRLASIIKRLEEYVYYPPININLSCPLFHFREKEQSNFYYNALLYLLDSYRRRISP